MKYKLIKALLFSVLSIFLFACNTNQVKKEKGPLFTPDKEQTLFTNYYHLDPSFKRLNFPFWFDRNQIRTHQITQLEIVNFNNKDSLKESAIKFEFYKTGVVKKINYHYYDEEVQIKEDIIEYKNDSSDFQQFRITKSNTFNQKKYVHDYFTFLESTGNDNGYIIYESLEPTIHSSEVYILSKEKQTVSTIDQFPQTLKDAVFIYGPTHQPTKRFFQKELVQRDGEINYNYFNNDLIKSMRENHNNYYVETTFNYDSTGKFKETINNTFTKTDSVLIDTKLFRIKYDSLINHQLPIQFDQVIKIGDSLIQENPITKFYWTSY